ncbi:PilZ domain-containing protein [Methylovulum psychrotolerans]|jgi:hypothetical protein|uniref:PilZ domain-containing protein n=1 Tax=Methylovulum psychrotolerans TaxID=1704499 RepID=UPI001BFFC822|nr:PilZ domain-containing protein [Methylovulum psychrotolerans]MBT9097880.1 PilZ domain-containing protein [Methylovulum psychrotolerans]
MSQIPENKRRHVRVPTNLAYRFVVENQEYVGQVGNISLSGAFLSAPNPPLNPSHLCQSGILQICLHHEALTLKCDIIYAATIEGTFPVGVGVCFSETDAPTQQSIKALEVALGLKSHPPH